MAPLQESLATVDKAHRQAYILEEKNSKDKRALDTLKDLSDEHKPMHKEALADVAALAEKVKSAKRTLTKVKGKFESKMRIKQVKQNIEDRTTPIDELARTAEDLNLGEFPVDETEMSNLKKGLAAVQKTHGEASQLEKLVARDRRALAKKSGLDEEDLNARKQMITDVEALAGKVEDAKSRLADFTRKLKAKMQIKQVILNIENFTAPIDALARTASDMSESELPVGTTGMKQIEEAVAAVEEAQKEAKHFGELLLKDTGALRELSDLPEDDSQTCKDTISGVEALAESLENARTSLLELHKELKGKQQIKKIMQNIDERTVEIHELLGTTAELRENGIPAQKAGIEEAVAAVEKAQKDALYLGEYIIKDMIAVDKLTSLSDEDRQARKKTIVDMNALSDKVESAKSRLADHHRQLKEAQ